MPQYFFRDGHGSVHRIAASDLAEAVTKAREVGGEGWRVGYGRPRVKISATERMWLWRELAGLVADGVPLAAALVQLSQAAATGPARVAAARLADLCAQGMSLADALRCVPGVADDAQIGLIAGAEAIGRLGQAIQVIADLSEADADTSAELSLRWMYPVAVAVLGLVVLPLFAVVVRSAMPALRLSFWYELGLRREDLGLSEAVWVWVSHAPVVAIGIAGVILILVLVLRAAGVRGSRLADRLLYIFPGYGAYRFHRRLAVFFHALSLAREAGVPDPQVVGLARGAVGPALSMLLLPVQGMVEAGRRLDEALADARWLPEISRRRLLAATPETFGEVAAELGRRHRKLADFYARRFVTIAEPVMVVIVALAVGALALATFGPAATLVTILSGLTQ